MNTQSTPKHRGSFYARQGKRWFDAVVAGMLLCVLAPLMGIVALIVRLKLGSPVLFRQLRPGLHGQPFLLYKFRTMISQPVGAEKYLSDAERLTDFGRFLRSTSLDELPELWNVFVGDMSLVGPRPLLMQYLERYSSEQMRRHDVRPGITGWAQISGRNAVSWDDRFALDVRYVENLSLLLDLQILAGTVRKVLIREGISQAGQATMEEFKGNQS